MFHSLVHPSSNLDSTPRLQGSRRVSDVFHFVWAAMPATAWAIFAQSEAPSSDVWGLIERLGLPVVLLVFFVWQAWRDKQSLITRVEVIETQQKSREDRMAARIEALERFQESTLLEIVKETNLLKSQLVEALREQTEAFKNRPCIFGDKAKV